MAERVLVLGGGLAGVAAALRLGDEGVDVTLVDRNDYLQFQPLLYQVASSQLPAKDIARPHRTIFKDYPSVTVLTADVTAASWANGAWSFPRATLTGFARGDGRGSSAELLRGTRRRRARFRCTPWPTPSGCGSTCSSCCKKPWTAKVPATRARSTSWSSAAAQPVSRPPAHWPS